MTISLDIQVFFNKRLEILCIKKSNRKTKFNEFKENGIRDEFIKEIV